MGKMVTAATTISAGAEKVQPSRAIRLRLTSGRPTRGVVARTCSAVPEVVVTLVTPSCRGGSSPSPAHVIFVARKAAQGQQAVLRPADPGPWRPGYRPLAALDRAVLAADWAVDMAAAGLTEPDSAAFTFV